jgi:hypothetical protein
MNIPDTGFGFFSILDPKKVKKAPDPGSGTQLARMEFHKKKRIEFHKKERIEFHKKEKINKHQRRLLLVDTLPSREYGNIRALGNTEQKEYGTV